MTDSVGSEWSGSRGWPSMVLASPRDDAPVREHRGDGQRVDDALLEDQRHAVFQRDPGQRQDFGGVRLERAMLLHALAVEDRREVLDVVEAGPVAHERVQVVAGESRLLQALAPGRLLGRFAVVDAAPGNLSGLAVEQEP